MISKEQLANEQRKEAEYNKLFEAVIAKSPFGQWYPLMIGASNMLTKNIPNRVGVDEDGRPIVVYKSEVGKVIGVWAVPLHKTIAKDLSQGDYKATLADVIGSGLFGSGFGLGQIKEIVKQKKAKFFDISSQEVKDVYNRKNAEAKQQQQQQKDVNPKKDTVNSVNLKNTNNIKLSSSGNKKNYIQTVIFSIIGLSLVVGLFVYSKK